MSEHEELLGRLDDCAAIRAIGNGQSERNTFAEAAAAIRKLETERNEARSERDALRALLKEAGEVLEPFASVVLPLSEWQAGWPDYAPLDTAIGSGRPPLTIGECRRARAFRAKIKEATDGR